MQAISNGFNGQYFTPTLVCEIIFKRQAIAWRFVYVRQSFALEYFEGGD